MNINNDSNIEIIECGFLNPNGVKNTTQYKSFTEVNSYIKQITKEQTKNTMFVAMIELDKYLLELSDDLVVEVEKDGALDKASGTSASNLAQYVRSDILARYAADRNGTVQERFNRAKDSVFKEFGYVNGTLVNFVDDYRGTGKYKQKQPKLFRES